MVDSFTNISFWNKLHIVSIVINIEREMLRGMCMFNFSWVLARLVSSDVLSLRAFCV